MHNRLGSIQLLRGVAALMVLAAHALETSVAYHMRAGGDPLTAAKALSVIGASGVDLFFVISGFVMAFSIGRFVGAAGAWRFLVQRAIRIVPLYWLVSVAFVAFLALSGAAPEPRSMIETITILPLFDGASFHIPPLGVGWTLSFEAGFYVLVAGAIALRGDGTTRLLWLSGLAGTAGIALVPGWAAARMIVNPMMLEFAMGVVVFEGWRRGMLERRGAALLIVGLLLIVLSDAVFDIGGVPVAAGKVLSSQFSLARAATRGLIAAVVVAVSVGGGGKRSPDGAPIRAGRAIGDASYSIYLVHAPVIAVLAPWIAMLGMPWQLFAVALTAASLAAGIAVYRLVETPMLGWFRSRGAAVPRRRSAAAA